MANWRAIQVIHLTAFPATKRKHAVQAYQEGESEQALFLFLPLFIYSSHCTFSPVSHINTVVGKGKSRDPAVENGTVGTQLRVFTVGSCLVHSALHALLKVHTLKVCPAELQGKGSV